MNQDAPQKTAPRIPRYRGFNLTEKAGGWGPRKKFNEEDFEILSDWGLNFARIPMSYWNWASKNDWYSINEDVLKDIDEAVDLGKKCGVHINPHLAVDW
jgi:endoglucanase